jgi:hypothetical protein
VRSRTAPIGGAQARRSMWRLSDATKAHSQAHSTLGRPAHRERGRAPRHRPEDQRYGVKASSCYFPPPAGGTAPEAADEVQPPALEDTHHAAQPRELPNEREGFITASHLWRRCASSPLEAKLQNCFPLAARLWILADHLLVPLDRQECGERQPVIRCHEEAMPTDTGKGAVWKIRSRRRSSMNSCVKRR